MEKHTGLLSCLLTFSLETKEDNYAVLNVNYMTVKEVIPREVRRTSVIKNVSAQVEQ